MDLQNDVFIPKDFVDNGIADHNQNQNLRET